MEWTPEAIKAEMDYRQKALREDSRRYQELLRSGYRPRSWWHRMTHRHEPQVPAA
ncbi:hypothetical protein [Lentzea tibetensis]|uniref:hypothetical protein n=1 Tax=Lentzea tibetensis TaxID=2591470 RepID=UPI001648731A|nr:hypothetical protein [Lentzea tibetensis]